MKRLTALLLHRHTITVATLIVALGVIAAFVMVIQARQRVELISARHVAEDISRFVREFRTLYTSEVTERLRPHAVEMRHDYKQVDGAIPLPATFTMELLKNISQAKVLRDARLYSDHPFPWRKQRVLDGFERDALQALKANPNKPFMRVETVRGEHLLRYATADLMRSSCVACHNSRLDSPKHDWHVGDLRGVLEVNISLDHEREIVNESMRGVHFTFTLLMVAGVFGLILIGVRLRKHALLLEEAVEARTDEVQSLARFPDENPSPVLRVSPTGELLYMNPASADLAAQIGLAVGKPLPTELAQVYNSMQESVSLEGGAHVVHDLELQAGERWYLMKITRLQDGQCNIYGSDISQRKQAEQKLQHLERVKSLGVLAGGIAHDFNNLLTAILGHAMLGKRHVDAQSPLFKHLNGIEQASKSAANLCQQMLAYSGKGSFVIQPIDLSALVQEMADLISVAISKHIEVTFQLSDDLPMIEGDVGQLQQVVLNLLTNAAEAIGDAAGQITITTGVMDVSEAFLQACVEHEQIQPGRFVYLRVIDTGCGMDETTISKMFDPFFTTKFTGRGLGMSAMLGIVRGHHGLLHIDSQPGYGTTIQVAFPVGQQPAGTADAEATAQPSQPCRGTVLVIDDEASLRDVARSMLETFGLTVLTANDGVEGVARFREQCDTISLVLLDLTMPKMDGIRCLAALHEIRPDLPVILSSGYSEEEIRARFTDDQPTAFLQKPYTPAQLQRLIEQLIAGQAH